MLKNRKFNDKEINLILKNMVILIDKREKTDHIKKWMEYKNRCEVKDMSLSQGDYSFMIKAIPELGILNDLYYDREICIEKKSGLNEISQNFTKHRARFEHELSTYPGKMVILIEDCWSNLFQGNYDANYNRKSFIGSVMAFYHRYNVPFHFQKKEEMGVFIYTFFRYYMREKLK